MRAADSLSSVVRMPEKPEELPGQSFSMKDTRMLEAAFLYFENIMAPCPRESCGRADCSDLVCRLAVTVPEKRFRKYEVRVTLSCCSRIEW